MELPPHLFIHIGGATPAVWILGHKRQEVVGEFYRWQDLHAACDRIRGATAQPETVQNGGSLAYFAWLIREPTNAEDSNAVAVYFDQVLVGYLPRTIAPRWADAIAACEARYRARVACAAHVEAKSEDGIHSVWLMLTTSANKARRIR